MNIRVLTATAFAATALTATAAAAQSVGPDSGWYVQGNAGANFQSEINGGHTAKGDTGWTVSGAVGRAIGDGFRGEGEVTYLDSDGKHTGAGDLKTVAGLVNGYYDFNRQGAFQPFVGAGIGFAQVKVDGGPNDGDDTGFAYQFKAGVSHPFNDRLTGEVAYRYFGVNGIKFGQGLTRINGDYTTQAVTVGLRYKLGL
jgi:opacity protein-like surface antigen